MLGVILAAGMVEAPVTDQAGRRFAFTCSAVRVVDGDTLRCGPIRVRLAHIDAPELAGHCIRGRQCTPGDPIASAANLQRLVGAKPPACQAIDRDRYGRTIAFCAVGRVDLSCAQVAGGFAVQRYGTLNCSGNRRRIK